MKLSGVLLILLGLAWMILGREAPRSSARSVAVDALGPFADLASTIEWARMNDDLVAGDFVAAIEHGENAVALRPEVPNGWSFLAWTLATKASPTRTPDPDERQAWLKAAISVARRGEARSTAPERLALLQAMLLFQHAELDTETRFPGGVEGVHALAIDRLRHAESLGATRATELLDALGR